MSYSYLITALVLLGTATTQPLFSDAPAPGNPTDVEFKARVDGSSQRYVEMLPANFDKSKPHSLMIVFHGGGSDRWQYVTNPRDECRGARDVATKYGMIYIAPECRGKLGWMGPKAEADIVQIIRNTQHKYKINKTYVVGASMGAYNALTFAVLHPDMVNGVSAQNAIVTRLESEPGDSVIESFGGLPKQMPLEYKKRSPEYWPEKLTMPVSFTVGGKDSLAPPQSVRRFAEVLKNIGASVLIIDRADNDHLTNYEDTCAAIEFVVKESSNQ